MVYDGGGVSLSSGRIFPDYLTSVRDGGFYWVAMELLRPTRGSKSRTEAARYGREGDRSRLC